MLPSLFTRLLCSALRSSSEATLLRERETAASCNASPRVYKSMTAHEGEGCACCAPKKVEIAGHSHLHGGGLDKKEIIKVAVKVVATVVLLLAGTLLWSLHILYPLSP